MKILLVAPDHPFELSYGLGQRINLLYRALQEHGDVDVVVVQESYIPEGNIPDMEGFHGILRWDPNDFSFFRWYSHDPKLAAWRKEKGLESSYDLVVSQHLTPLTRLGGFADTPAILDYDDADHIVEYDYDEDGHKKEHTGLLGKIRHFIRMRQIRKAMSRYQWVWFTSESDRSATPFANGDVLPNIPFSPPQTTSAELPESKTVLWVGSMTFRPNFVGIRAFLRNEWPAIRAAVPDAVFRAVGLCPDELKEEFADLPGVEFPGFVDDLEAEYRQARFSVAPTNFNGGTNIKVLESFVNGRTCVLTPFSHYGYETILPAGEAVLVAHKDGDMAKHCIRLLSDHELCSDFTRKGVGRIRDYHNYDNFRKIVAQRVQAVVAGRNSD